MNSKIIPIVSPYLHFSLPNDLTAGGLFAFVTSGYIARPPAHIQPQNLPDSNNLRVWSTPFYAIPIIMSSFSTILSMVISQ
jgi:hypothetical protein